jgi:type 1 glutamine amidotransferase
VTEGLEPFATHDELYYQEVRPDVSVHMVAIDRGRAIPMVWTRAHGKGRVVHLAGGHSERVWALPEYRRLLRQAVEWAAGDA